MDQIRTSQVKHGGYYAVNYDQQYKADDPQTCSNICVSDMGCKVWKYVGGESNSLGGACSTSSEDPKGKMWTFNENGFGGEVEYANHYSLVQIIVFIVVMIIFGISLGNLLRMYYSN